VDESELPDCDQRSHARVDLFHQLAANEPALVHMLTWQRDQQKRHQHKARAPDDPGPEQYVHRVHARPRHDRRTKFALILPIAKQKLLCGAVLEAVENYRDRLPGGLLVGTTRQPAKADRLTVDSPLPAQNASTDASTGIETCKN
jgi:hypothetical protein